VLVVSGSARIREVLLPVYSALGLHWDPGTVGSVAEEVPGVTYEDVIDSIRAELDARHKIVVSSLDQETVALAERLEAEHLAPVSPGGFAAPRAATPGVPGR
jgi:hypothetical protein